MGKEGVCVSQLNLTLKGPLPHKHSAALLFKTRMYIIYKMAQNSWHLGVVDKYGTNLTV